MERSLKRLAATTTVALLSAALLAGAFKGGLIGGSTLGVRARHETHVVMKGMDCTACHVHAPTSTRSADLLLPTSSDCERCHKEAACQGPVKPVCKSCHAAEPRSILAARFDHAGRVTVNFDHAGHAERVTSGCRTCHPLHPARPDDRNPLLPTMPLCISCHPHEDAFEADRCIPCHVKTKKGTLKLDPAGLKLVPPAWMHGASHDGAWVLEHSSAAATRPGLCAACHTDTDCASCHAGKVKPEAIHPGDWLHFHPVSAALGELRCSSCHSYQDFCITCHRKVGAAWDSPSKLGVPAGDVFHPEGWYSLSGPGKHAAQARKNLTSCVSCHTESDCISCHSASSALPGVGSPHPPASAWLTKCKVLVKKNPTSCLKCHPSVPAACR